VQFKAAIARQLRSKVWPLFEMKKLAPVIYQVFPLEQASVAHATMEQGDHIGKIVLQML